MATATTCRASVALDAEATLVEAGRSFPSSSRVLSRVPNAARTGFSSAPWAALPPDLVRLVGSFVLGRGGAGLKGGFNDLLAMTQACGPWRSALLDSPSEGLLEHSFQLPVQVTNGFVYCSVGGGKRRLNQQPCRLQQLMSRNRPHLPGKLPKLVTRSAQWGNPSAALVVAAVATEICMAGSPGLRSGNTGPGVWQKYWEICEDLGKKKDPKGGYTLEAAAFDLVHLWKRGARLGSKLCQAVLGEAFYCGGGVELSRIPCANDVEQAVLWLSRAVDHGADVEGADLMLARSELLLAYIFQDGQEGESSYSDMMLYGRSDRAIQEAVFWFRRAAKHGSIEAQEALRSMYSTGQY